MRLLMLFYPFYPAGLLSCVFVLGGCQAILGIDDTSPRDDTAAIDGGIDAATGNDAGGDAATNECATWAPVHFDPCMYWPPSAAPVLANENDYQLDTDTRVLTGGPVSVTLPGYDLPQTTGSALLLMFEDFTLPQDSTLRVVGMRPLIIGSWSKLTIVGTIDASGSGESGAGAASAPGCDATAGQSSGFGAGGGGGGGFGGAGGPGGSGNSGTVAEGAAGSPVNAPETVRAGCPGRAGGNGQSGSVPGAGGNAGGAVQLTAHGLIDVEGIIDTGGGRGDGGRPDAAGGGGGGSGGYIGFDSAEVRIRSDAIVVANGGGGGEGADLTYVGNPGENGRRLLIRARGGRGSAGGDGGDGGSAEGQDGVQGVTHSRGGGGGGGGTGHIVSYNAGNTSVEGNATVSPAMQLLPRP